MPDRPRLVALGLLSAYLAPPPPSSSGTISPYEAAQSIEAANELLIEAVREVLGEDPPVLVQPRAKEGNAAKLLIEGSGGSALEGNLLVVAATVCWASYPVLSLPLLRSYSPLVVAAYAMLFGGFAILPLALTGLLGTDWEVVGGRAWVALAYSTLCVSAFGFYAWQSGTSRLGANRVLIYQYLIVLVGVVSGVVLLGERLTLN